MPVQAHREVDGDERIRRDRAWAPTAAPVYRVFLEGNVSDPTVQGRQDSCHSRAWLLRQVKNDGASRWISRACSFGIKDGLRCTGE